MTGDDVGAAFDPVAYLNEPRWQQSRLGLDRVRALLQVMGDPQRSLRFVHVAGTNGKGSTCALVASILRCAGVRTGLFTSPFIFEFAERIQVDGRVIFPDQLREVTLFVRQAAEQVFQRTGEHPTEFELMAAVAFEHFKRQGCQMVVLEVGLGGRLDATNVIEAPEVCVITRLGLDHTDILGDTLAQVAAEKAGIIKPGATVASWPQEDPAAQEVIVQKAHECGCELHIPDFSQLEVGPVEFSPTGPRRRFSWCGQQFLMPLLATYQPRNAAMALTVAGLLAARGWPIDKEACKRGVAQVAWPGRFQVVEGMPVPLVVDGGHNPQGAAALAESLRDVFGERRVVFVMGVLADKDYRAMIDAVLPQARAFVCVAPPIARALPAGDLAQVVKDRAGDRPVEVAPDYERALACARRLSKGDDVICAFGSLYGVAPLTAAL